MDEKFRAILSVALIPATVALIVERDGLDDIAAVQAFYRSRVYEFLSREETKLWHYSPLTLYMMYKHEAATGEVVFPEG